MNVIFDISALANAQLYPSNKAGVLRVVEEVGAGLYDILGKDVQLSAAHSTDHFRPALTYAAQHPRLRKAKALDPWLGALRWELGTQFFSLENTLTRRIQSGSVRGGRWNPSRVARKALHLARMGLEPSEHRLIRRRDLEKADVYHTSYFPVPKAIRSSSIRATVATVYDLIPILFPEFFRGNPDSAETVRNVLADLQQSDWVIVISQTTKDDLCNYLPALDPNRVTVAPLAASNHFFPVDLESEFDRVREKYGLSAAPYVLSLCTLEPRKNLQAVIRAFAALIKEQSISDLDLVLVGQKGWNYEGIYAAFDECGLPRERVFFPGFVDDEDQAAIYSGSTMFVFPSFYEGFGLPPLEAMQCGVPVITSNTSSLPEVVGTAGLLVSPNDLDALAQAMLDVYSDSELRSDLSRLGRERAQAFTWRKTVESIISGYSFALET